MVKQFGKFAGAKKADQLAAEEAAKRKADAERKRAMFEEVLEIDAEDPVALFGLGNALSTLGERESDTARLEQAVEAYRAALQEGTRERVPLDWAMTQNNLGDALRVLGEREIG